MRLDISPICSSSRAKRERSSDFSISTRRRAAHAADEPPLELSERARLRELERRNRELEIEIAFLKKVAAHFAREQR
jgi:transposase-like protein